MSLLNPKHYEADEVKLAFGILKTYMERENVDSLNIYLDTANNKLMSGLISLQPKLSGKTVNGKYIPKK